MTSTAVDRTLVAGPRRLGIRVHGTPDGPPMLCVHGWLDNAASFDRLAPHWPNRNVVALDLPGHGHSDHLPAGVPYLFLDHVAAVHSALAALGWARCVLVGHSLGAAVVTTFAGAFPDRVERVVAIEGLGPLADPPEAVPQRLADALEQERRPRVPTVHPDLETAIARLRAATGLSDIAARTLAERGLMPVDGGLTWRSDPRLRDPSRLRLAEVQVEAFLRRIACPVLIVRGDRGLAFAPRDTSPRVGVLRDARVVTVAGGHHVHLDAPDEVAAALASFLGTGA